MLAMLPSPPSRPRPGSSAAQNAHLGAQATRWRSAPRLGPCQAGRPKPVARPSWRAGVDVGGDARGGGAGGHGVPAGEDARNVSCRWRRRCGASQIHVRLQVPPRPPWPPLVIRHTAPAPKDAVLRLWVEADPLSFSRSYQSPCHHSNGPIPARVWNRCCRHRETKSVSQFWHLGSHEHKTGRVLSA